MPFDHLVLLIGTNPLPNFVVAEYFLKKERNLRNIWLVHSEKTIHQEGTLNYAENLSAVLMARHPDKGISFNFVPVTAISDARQIRHDINEFLISRLPQNSIIQLNYTGGTKVMSIHVYLALSGEVKKRLVKSFTYLDARTFRIVDDTAGILTVDLRGEVSLTFEELIKLHGFRRKNKNSICVDFSSAVHVFRKAIESRRLLEFLDNKSGYNRAMFESKKKKRELAERIDDIDQDLLNSFKPNEVFQCILSAMPDGYRVFENGIGKRFKKAVKFLDGEWLEEYIYSVLKEHLKGSSEILKNWEMKKEGWIGCFELDVIVMKGYQLFGISCTTSQDKSLCKSKGFEVIHRSRQIGGDEAKAVLVTLLDDERKKQLRDEVLLDTGALTENILVLGLCDIGLDPFMRKMDDFFE